MITKWKRKIKWIRTNKVKKETHDRSKAMHKNWTSKVTAQGKLHNARPSHRGPHDSGRSLRSLCPYTRWYRDLFNRFTFHSTTAAHFASKQNYSLMLRWTVPIGITHQPRNLPIQVSDPPVTRVATLDAISGCGVAALTRIRTRTWRSGIWNIFVRSFESAGRVWVKLRHVGLKWVILRPLSHFVKCTQSFGRKKWRERQLGRSKRTQGDDIKMDTKGILSVDAECTKVAQDRVPWRDVNTVWRKWEFLQ